MTYGNGRDLSDMSMMGLFRMEAENQCIKLSEDLLALELTPTASALLESLMRASHSLKGAARIVELHPAVRVAHAMEDVFVAAQDSKIILDKKGIDLLLKGLDLFNSISHVSDEDIDNFFAEKTTEISALVNSYALLVKGVTASTKTSLENLTKISRQTDSGPGTTRQSPEVKTAQLPVDLSDMSMLDLFRMEAEKHFTRLTEDLVALKKAPARSDLFESMIRDSFSMMDAARIVNLDEAVKLVHAMADILNTAYQEKVLIGQNDIDSMLNCVDLLLTIARIPETDTERWLADHRPDIDNRFKILEELAERVKSLKPVVVNNKSHSKVSTPESSFSKNEHNSEKATESAPRQKQDNEKKPVPLSVDKDGFRFVRVSARNMDQMMGLAGESLIESRWLPTFNKELLRLKYRQDELYEATDKIMKELQTVKPVGLSINLFGDLQNKLETCRNMLTQNMGVLEDHARHATNISDRLYKEILISKMRPFSEGTRGFARMVRDVASELGKEVTFEVIGSDTMVDRDILDKIDAPLNHLIRNALDHGIEQPAERVAMGKPGRGTIQLIARHSAGMLTISVKDDGRGIDLEKLRQIIVNKKLCAPDIAVDLSEHELLEFLFLPNFSTKNSVDEISGRGVGMDVVHTTINEVRGKIHSSTKLSEGSTFELQLPLTLSVLKALLTEINNELYAFPLVSIDHVLQLTQEQIQEIEGRQYFTFKDKRIGIVSAQQVFKTKNSSFVSKEYIYVIVFSDRLNFYGLTVDKLRGIRDLVVQHLDPRLGKIKDINSASILEDGTPVLIVDVEDVFSSLDQLISGNRLIPIGEKEDHRKRTKRILVADDSITVREVERKMLIARGYEVDVAVDGMDAWNKVRANDYDLIISDIDMPRMNGFELVTLIKNDPNLRNLPVIIVSYKDRVEEKNKGLEIGADYYITKGSFQDQALVNAVHDLIGDPEE
jgi:two-component system sensor histidine kinase and response regulator WspE